VTTQRQNDQDPDEKLRDPDFAGAEAAMKRAANIARRRAMETSGSVAIFQDGKIVWIVWDEATGGLHTEDTKDA
jgi:hypothetical protein